MNSAITKKVILGLQESIETLEDGVLAKMDLQSAGLDKNTGGTDIGKLASKLPKSSRNANKLERNVSDSSLEPIRS